MYSGKKEVRKYNSEEFINDFKRIREFVIKSRNRDLYTVSKAQVWENAKKAEIFYEITDRIYLVKRNVMLLK